MGNAISAPDRGWAKNTCDLGTMVSVKPRSSIIRRSSAKVTLGLDMGVPLPSKPCLEEVLVSCDGPDRSRVEPFRHRDMDSQRLATDEQLGCPTTGEILLDVNPVRLFRLSIVHDQDHRIGLGEPELEV